MYIYIKSYTVRNILISVSTPYTIYILLFSEGHFNIPNWNAVHIILYTEKKVRNYEMGVSKTSNLESDLLAGV